MSLVPIDPIFLTDTVTIYPRVLVETGDMGTPVIGRGAGVTRSCAVQRVNSTSAETRRQQRGDAIVGVAMLNLVFPDGDDLPTGADWDVEWVSHNGTNFPAPILMHSLGAAEPPGGLSSRWTVACERVS